jgi:hypothetical protein
MTKKEYMKPTMNVVRIQNKSQILAGSLDANGMNKSLQSEEVGSAWSRGSNGWDDDED